MSGFATTTWRRFLFILCATAAMFVLFFPLVAAFDSLRQVGLAGLDAGGSTSLSRTLLSCAVLFGVVVALILPAPAPAAAHAEAAGPAAEPTPQAAATGDPMRGATVALIVLVGVWGLSALGSHSVADTLLHWQRLFIAALFFGLTRVVVRRRANQEHAVKLFLLVATLTAFDALVLYALDREGGAGALVGTFYQADVAASYFLLAVPLALSLAVGAADRRDRFLFAILTALMGTALLMTYSRGGVLAAAVAVVAMIPAWWRLPGPGSAPGRPVVLSRAARLRRVVLPPVAVAAVVVLMAGVATSSGSLHVVPQRAVARAAELGRSDSSVVARVAFWRGAVRMARARPLLGWGPGTFGRIFPRFQTDVRYYSKYVHSQFLAFLGEGGVLTLGAFVIWLVLLGRAGLQAVRRQSPLDPARAALQIGILGSLLGGVVHMAVDVDWEFDLLQIGWFGLAGLLAAMMDEDAGRASHVDCPYAVLPALPRVGRLGACLVLLGVLALQPFPFRCDAELMVADQARRRGDFAEALAASESAVGRLPCLGDPWRSVTEACLGLLDARRKSDPALTRRAVEAARTCVQLDPERAINQEALARACLQAGDRPAFVAATEEALRRDPVNYPDFYNLLADVRMQEGRLSEARRLLMIPAAMYPPDVFASMWFFRRETLFQQLTRTFLSLARLERATHHDVAARNYLRRAVDTDPRSIVARFELGTLLMGMRDPRGAYVEFQAIHSMKPDDPFSQWLLGLSCHALGQRERARALFVAAGRAEPSLRNVGRGHEPLRIPPAFFADVPDPRRNPALEFVR